MADMGEIVSADNVEKIGRANDGAILVTGGAGFIGSAVVKELARKNNQIVALYRHRLPETHQNIYPVCSDMSSPELLSAPMRGVSSVIHLAWDGGLAGPQGEFSWDLAVPERLPRNIQVLRNLISVSERSKIEKIIFVSAVGASRTTTIPFLMEKYLAEFFILNSKIPQKIIIRSSIVCGEQPASDRFVKTVSKVMKLPIYPVPKSHKAFSPIHINDLCRYIVNASASACTAGGTIAEALGGESYKVEELFKLVSDHMGGTRLPLKGAVGNSLVSLFERSRKREGENSPKIRHFLAIGSATASTSLTDKMAQSENNGETTEGSIRSEKIAFMNLAGGNSALPFGELVKKGGHSKIVAAKIQKEADQTKHPKKEKGDHQVTLKNR